MTPMQTDVESVARSCGDCGFADGIDCIRSRRRFRQHYETKYTDDDFCGPTRRYWTSAAHLKGNQNGN
jgi:hypothetical protein